ncbi:hypothetical protein [Microbacterium sp.]|uniref:hypothetical protein n=1 Tax=Microbacterium sp. TaxID=51671 RepID=UPI0039E42B7D
MIALIRSETTKLLTARGIWILALVTVFGTLPMAWTNSASTADLPADSKLLFSSVPIPPEYQGFEMAGFGYVLVVALAALWAGSEYGGCKQIRTTLLATPKRLRVFLVKTALLAALVALVAFVTMTGTIVITHAAGSTGVDPWALTPAIWAHIGGVTLAWTLTGLIAFAVGVIARTAILPLILIVPLVIGVGDFLAGFWAGARFLPTTAGASMYNDPASGIFLAPATGALVQACWALVLLTIAAVSFTRRDL